MVQLSQSEWARVRVRLFFDSSVSDLRSGQKGRRYMAYPRWSLEAVFALTLVPRERPRRDEYQVWWITWNRNVPVDSRISAGSTVERLSGLCPPHKPFAITSKALPEQKEKAFKMKSKETVSANRAACEGWKIHRFAPALAPLRCAHPDQPSSKMRKRKQTRSVRLTKLKPYQRQKLSDGGTDGPQHDGEIEPAVRCSVLLGVSGRMELASVAHSPDDNDDAAKKARCVAGEMGIRVGEEPGVSRCWND